MVTRSDRRALAVGALVLLLVLAALGWVGIRTATSGGIERHHPEAVDEIGPPTFGEGEVAVQPIPPIPEGTDRPEGPADNPTMSARITVECSLKLPTELANTSILVSEDTGDATGIIHKDALLDGDKVQFQPSSAEGRGTVLISGLRTGIPIHWRAFRGEITCRSEDIVLPAFAVGTLVNEPAGATFREVHGCGTRTVPSDFQKDGSFALEIAPDQDCQLEAAWGWWNGRRHEFKAWSEPVPVHAKSGAEVVLVFAPQEE